QQGQLAVSVNLNCTVKDVFAHLAGFQFRLTAPPAGRNGVLMIGLTAAGQPMLMVHARCPTTGVVWHLCLGGKVPVVWKTAN
ncbi:MAG: hypothetical protein ACRC33_23735, partial [Gemmataceae bacterium]